MHWNIAYPDQIENLEQLQQVLLENRHISNEKGFFNPPQPTKINVADVGLDKKHLDLAIERLKQAKKNKERVVIFGDYDADGVCATGILWQALYDLDFDVHPFIPERQKHGYGLSLRALEDLLKEEQPALIITVDNGIVAHEAAQFVQDQGIDLIITDHHQPEDALPPALAIVHTTQLCGATVSWMFAREILTSFKKKVADDWQLDLAGIATVADQVPLQGANRAFAFYGVEALRKTKRIGLKAIFEQATIDQKKLDAGMIGFGIAPRINAMGRLEHSLDALRLLLTTDKQRAADLAQTLGETNTERQDMTLEMYFDALSQAKKLKDEPLIIVYSENYHEGVLGLIAGRLMEKFYKPAIALAVDDKLAKGSARSVAGVNIVDLIREVRDDLLEVGGHPMAAGFGLEKEKLERVMERLHQLARETIDANLLEQSLEIDAQLAPAMVGQKTVETIEKFAPFGQANPEPIFVIDDVEIMEMMTLGKDGLHLKIVGRIADGVEPIEFLAWRKGKLIDELQAGQKIKIAGVLELNHWNGKTKTQVVVKDLN